MCANFIYDLNGLKGPNTVGKDIGFITAIYPTDPQVAAPNPIGNFTWWYHHAQALSTCKKRYGEDARLPNIDELTSLFYNQLLTDMDNGNFFWSTSAAVTGKMWTIHWGKREALGKEYHGLVQCVKR